MVFHARNLLSRTERLLSNFWIELLGFLAVFRGIRFVTNILVSHAEVEIGLSILWT